MSHLTDEEFVDWIDGGSGGLPDARRAHLEVCVACRGQRDAMAAVLAQVVEADVPEPSPLYWDHMSARVREAIATPPPVAMWKDRLPWPGTAWLAGLASIVLAVVVTHGVLPRAPLTTPSVAMATHAPAVVTAPDAPEPPDDIDSDEAWALVRSVADDVAPDEAQDAGISTRPDAAERMTLELSTREQSELAQLLQSELKHAGL